MQNWKKAIALVLLVSIVMVAAAGCAAPDTAQTLVDLGENLEQASKVPLAAASETDEQPTQTLEEIEPPILPLSAAPVAAVLQPVASGEDVRANDKAQMDVSNAADGYIMVRYTAEASATLMVVVTGPSGVKYNYFLNNAGKYEVFPLSDGNGTYQATVYKNVTGSKYATEFSDTLDVTLKDEFAPFLQPNQYVNYTADSLCVAKAAELVAGSETTLESIGAVYNWVVENLSYDKQLAATVQSGYLPNLDNVMAQKTGICFDYAALLTAMLRSQAIPCKLVVGYSGKVYHAWISAYSEQEGWIDGVIYFDGKAWKLMDPTFASSADSSDSIMQYIGNGSNYMPKFLY